MTTQLLPVPLLVERDRGLGWLAATPANWPVQFAVSADDEAGAIEAFAETAARWSVLRQLASSSTQVSQVY